MKKQSEAKNTKETDEEEAFERIVSSQYTPYDIYSSMD